MKPNDTHRLSSVFIALCFLFITHNAFALGSKRPTTGGNSSSGAVPPVIPPKDPTVEDGSADGSSGGSTEAIAEKYSYVDQEKIVPAALLLKTLTYYDANLSKIKNKNYIVVIDFKQHNSKKRFYLINMQSGDVERYLTAHGKNSDPDYDGYATKFSNTSGSNMSSVGFYLTAETYNGDNGYSLRLDGLSSTNSNARSRAIVIHGASYVREASLIGRSYGCPALEVRYAADVINTIKGGSLIYADG
jgi:hypothetical protein